MRWSISRTLDAVLVVCAVATTAAVISRGRSPQRLELSDAMRPVTGWKEDFTLGRQIGSAAGPYRLLVWTDYQCPACKKFEGEVHRLRSRFGDSIAVAYRFYPLDVHPLAFRAAVAAECARVQGRFEPMHNALFAARLSGDSLAVAALAAEAGIENEHSFRMCLRDSAIAASVRADIARGKALDLHGTPSLEIGDKIATGGRSAEELIPLLRSARR